MERGPTGTQTRPRPPWAANCAIVVTIVRSLHVLRSAVLKAPELDLAPLESASHATVATFMSSWKVRQSAFFIWIQISPNSVCT